MAKNQIPTLKIERESVRIKIEIMELILHTPVTGTAGHFIGVPLFLTLFGESPKPIIIHGALSPALTTLQLTSGSTLGSP